MDETRSGGEGGGLSPAITRRVDRMWPVEEDRRCVREALARYGAESYEPEVDRVRLAILKLSNGDVASVQAAVATAKRDYRDVLGWAEYPEQMNAEWSRRLTFTRAEQDRLASIGQRDRLQYEAWLKKSDE